MVLNIAIHLLYKDFANLVALVKGYGCRNNEKLLLRSPSGDIDIIVLFMLHYSRSNLGMATQEK